MASDGYDRKFQGTGAVAGFYYAYTCAAVTVRQPERSRWNGQVRVYPLKQDAFLWWAS